MQPRHQRHENDPHVPLVLDEIDHSAPPSKPSWRGWIHAGTFPVAIALGVVLLVFAEGRVAKTSSAVFFAASVLLFGTSALYHRVNWSARVKAVFRRIDHANIFLLIAGTYTPITLLCLPREKATILLAAVWTAAVLGIGFRVFWLSAPRWLYVGLYLLMGWAAVAFIADFFRAAWVTMILVLVGGILYSLGAVIYGMKRPNPYPRAFGFHEIFHTLTVLAFVAQWTGVFLVAIHPPLR